MSEDAQLQKRLEWLDAERRKDADEISKLKKKLSSTEDTISKQAQQLKGLTEEVTRVSALASRVHKMDDSLAKHRQEVSRQLKELEEGRRKVDQQHEEIRKTDQKAISHEIDDLKVKLEKVDAIETSLETRQEEEVQIRRSQDEITKKLEALEGQDEIQGRTLMTLEEGLDSDHRRILDLQTEATELRKNLERSRGDLETEADRIRGIEIRIEEARASERTREEAQAAWMENQGLKIVNFEKDWKSWQSAFEDFQARADEFGDRVSTYEKTYKELMQMKNDLDETIERLERRITEVGEMHRLSEDRNKQDWSSFQSDEMKRWSTFKLTNDELWREHTRLHESLKEELKGISSDLENGIQTLEDIKLTDKLHMQEMMSLIKEWATEIEKAGK